MALHHQARSSGQHLRRTTLQYLAQETDSLSDFLLAEPRITENETGPGRLRQPTVRGPVDAYTLLRRRGHHCLLHHLLARPQRDVGPRALARHYNTISQIFLDRL